MSNYKNKLQEYCQKNKIAFPNYKATHLKSGHEPEWKVDLLFNGKNYSKVNHNKKQAESQVAELAYKDIGKNKTTMHKWFESSNHIPFIQSPLSKHKNRHSLSHPYTSMQTMISEETNTQEEETILYTGIPNVTNNIDPPIYKQLTPTIQERIKGFENYDESACNRSNPIIRKYNNRTQKVNHIWEMIFTDYRQF